MARILMVFTVPESLVFAAGQPAFLRARGHEVAVCTSPGPGLAEFGAREGCPAFAVPMARAIAPAADLQALAELVAVIRRFRPDIVHASTPKGGLLGTLAARLAGVPVRIYHVRGLVLATATGRKRELLRRVEQVACHAATHVVCVSHSLRNTFDTLKIFPASRIEVPLAGSGQGVDARVRFHPDRIAASTTAALREQWKLGDGPVVLFVGRLVGDKGICELAEAWAALATDFPSARLVLVGPWEERDAVPVEVRAALERHPTIVLTGRSDDVPAWYATSDLVVLPTYREGFPNVLLEAGAMRKPVVSTLVDGCVDAVVDGETGLLVPARDPLALEGALRRYLASPELRAQHGAAARVRVETLFDRQAIWGAIADIYDRQLAAR